MTYLENILRNLDILISGSTNNSIKFQNLTSGCLVNSIEARTNSVLAYLR
jgi:hypothetical protein